MSDEISNYGASTSSAPLGFAQAAAAAGGGAHTPPTPEWAGAGASGGQQQQQQPPHATGAAAAAAAAASARGRVRRACVACFTAKVRCSGEAPTCARCQRRNTPCVYDPEGNSRKSHRKRGLSVDEHSGAGGTGPGSGGGGEGARSAWSHSPSNPAAATATNPTGPTYFPDETRESPTSAAPPIVVRQPFFRWLGLTSVAPPGAPFRSLSVVVAEREPPTASGLSPASPTPLEPMLKSVDAEATVRTFYTLFESYLPYLPLGDTLEQLARGTLSEVVLVSMSMLVKRMRPESPGPSAEALADRAKALAVAHLALPSLDIVFGLLLLAYHEHGADRDSGLWAYCGLAIRMCIDLGLHKPFDTRDPGEAAQRSRIFWAVVCLDRIISCGTGRITTLPIWQIDVALPPPRDNIRTVQGVALPDPFPSLCRLLLILGNVSDAVNLSSTASNSSSSALPRVPAPVQHELVEFQANIPPALQFSIHTFSAYVSAGCAPAFLLLSLWLQAVHLAIHQAALLFTQPSLAGSDGTRVTPQSGSSAISIGDMLAYSGLISNDAFMCTPTLSQPIMMAGRAASALLKTLPSDTPKHQVEPLERAVIICKTTLEQMQRPWCGLSWHLESMTKNAREVDMSRIGARITTEDRGMLAKARMEDWSRKCSQLFDQLSAGPAEGEVVGVGLSSWGVTSAPDPTHPPLQPTVQPTVAVLRSGRASPILWNDDLGSLDFLSQESSGFWAGDWPAVPPGLALGGDAAPGTGGVSTSAGGASGGGGGAGRSAGLSCAGSVDPGPAPAPRGGADPGAPGRSVPTRHLSDPTGLPPGI